MKRGNDGLSRRTYGDDPTVHCYWGPWQQMVKLEKCLCEDGVERCVWTREPDTFFTIPGRTSAKGKSVTGYVSHESESGRLVFHATGKNRAVLDPS